MLIRLNEDREIPVEVFVWYFTFEGTSMYCLEILDISERYAHEQMIRENEEKYRDLFQNVNDAIFLFLIDNNGKPGKILEVNGIAEKMTGYSREELCSFIYSSLGQKLENIDCLDIHQYMNSHCARDWEIVTKSGEIIPVEESLHIFERNGIILGLSLLRDISERINHEEERAVAIEQIQKNMAELSILNDGIRNPLTVILAYTEANCPKIFDVIEIQVDQIDKTINQLDKRWNESDKILSFLKKHHGIEIRREK